MIKDLKTGKKIVLDKESNEYLEKLRKELELTPDMDKIRCTNKILRPKVDE
jgi:hypothetical protein